MENRLGEPAAGVVGYVVGLLAENGENLIGLVVEIGDIGVRERLLGGLRDNEGLAAFWPAEMLKDSFGLTVRPTLYMAIHADLGINL